MKKLFFTYGTLQKGNIRHGVLQQAEAEFVGDARTVGEFLLKDRGDFPLMVQLTSKQKIAMPERCEVKGEVYRVDEEVFADLDLIEGHPNFFTRSTISVRMEEGGYPIQVTCYMITHDKSDQAWYKYNVLENPDAEGGRWNRITGEL